jgi:hypothetical protein
VKRRYVRAEKRQLEVKYKDGGDDGDDDEEGFSS